MTHNSTPKIIPADQWKAWRKDIADVGGTVAVVTGTFALWHPGNLAAIREAARQAGIPDKNYDVLKWGQEKEIYGLKLKAVYADHGDLAPDAIGLLIDYNGIKIYNAGDTAYAPDKIIPSLASEVDVMIVPINGAFGNMNSVEACRLVGLVKPGIVIPAHFWMFMEHNGDPAKFLEEAKKIPAGIKPLIMAPGEKIVYPDLKRRKDGVAIEKFIPRMAGSGGGSCDNNTTG